MRYHQMRAHFGPVSAVLLGEHYVWTGGGMNKKTATLRLWDRKTYELSDEVQMDRIGKGGLLWLGRMGRGRVEHCQRMRWGG